METIEIYRGYKIYRHTGQKRLYVDGRDISCLQYFYNIENAKSFIDFTIKFTTPIKKKLGKI